MQENHLYRTTRLAETDLLEIWQVVADRNLPAANRLNDALADVFILLGREPLLGEMFDPIRPFLRRFAHDNYVIYYNATTQPIRILRVLHGAREVGGLI
jgi:plasmid stabilization system protein ParE